MLGLFNSTIFLRTFALNFWNISKFCTKIKCHMFIYSISFHNKVIPKIGCLTNEKYKNPVNLKYCFQNLICCECKSQTPRRITSGCDNLCFKNLKKTFFLPKVADYELFDRIRHFDNILVSFRLLDLNIE